MVQIIFTWFWRGRFYALAATSRFVWWGGAWEDRLWTILSSQYDKARLHTYH